MIITNIRYKQAVVLKFFKLICVKTSRSTIIYVRYNPLKNSPREFFHFYQTEKRTYNVRRQSIFNTLILMDLYFFNSRDSFGNTVDSSSIGIGCVLFQINTKRKVYVFPYTSRIVRIEKQKLFSTYREVRGIVYSLTKKR